jgi:hypothetical protein
MSQWGNTDDAANSVLWATTQVNLPSNTTNQTALFGNTTASGFLNNGVAVQRTVGQFGLDATEIAVSNASVVAYETTFAGSGYSANAVVTVGGNATANGLNTTGRISVLAVLPGNTYTTPPAVSVAAPTAQNIVANTTGVVAATDFIKIATANSIYLAGDKVLYTVPTGNTALTPLTGNAYYYIAFSNTTGVVLTSAPGAANIDITDTRTTASAEVHTFTGETATAAATISGVATGAAHTGWVLRTVGQGGRAGRVQYETLVAMGGNLSTDAEDVILKDA